MDKRQLLVFAQDCRLTWLKVVVAGVLVGAGAQAAQAQTQALAPVIVAADPIAPLPVDPRDPSKLLPGTGLCAAYRTTTTPENFFPARTASYPASVSAGTEPFTPTVNLFMDGKVGTAANSGTVAYQTLQTPFDLAAFASLGLNTDGDFINTPACAPNNAGCAFPAAGPSTSQLPPFGSRYRGFFRVTSALVGQVLHFGFTTNSAVALQFWPKLPTSDGSKVPYAVISRAAETGRADFRVTNAITFRKAGLYAVEIVHANFGSAARLEMAVAVGAFADVDELSGAGMRPLGAARGGFVLTTPEQFFQRVDGLSPVPGKPEQCQQCPREFADLSSQPKAPANGCPVGMFCNAAAVCAPAISDSLCGDAGQPCSAVTPYCAADPSSPGVGYHCVACLRDDNCSSGQKCQSNQCVSTCVTGSPGCESSACVGTNCPTSSPEMGCSASARGRNSAPASPVPYTSGVVLLGALALFGVRRLRTRRVANPPQAD